MNRLYPGQWLEAAVALVAVPTAADLDVLLLPRKRHRTMALINY